MPLLSFPELTQGYARSILIALYRNHPTFEKEFNMIKKPYIDGIRKYAKDTIIFFQEKPQSNTEYYQALMKYLGGESKVRPYNKEQEKDISELEPYFDALNKLTEKWIFKAPWAAGALFVLDLIQSMAVVPHEEIGIPMEIFEPMVPWPPPLPPLKIQIPSWTFFAFTRDDIMSEIAARISDYEQELKEMGIKEQPSSLIHHARWWFEHYVKGIKYDDIAQQETYTPGGSLISHAKNVGKAVRDFTKLVDINPKK
jgi:hypothetical protein